MTFRITSPGEYRTRDGRKATIWRLTNYGVFSAVGDIESVRETWQPNGLASLDAGDNGDIIAHWEEPKMKPTAKDIADIIAKFPKECQQQVTELVKTLGYPTQPEPKAGQVWKNTKPVINPIRLMVTDSLNDLIAVGLDGVHHTSKPKSFINDGEYVFVANSLAEYVANGGKL